LFLACLLYLLMLAAIFSMPGGDPASYGAEASLAASLSQLYALVFGVLLWVVLGILMLNGWRNGEMPRRAAIGVGVLYPLSAVAAAVAAGLSYSYPGGWLTLVPESLPPLVALYAIWARLPALHAILRPDITSGVTLGAVAMVIVATLPLAYLDALQFPARLARQDDEGKALIAKREAEFAMHEQEREAWLQRLTPDSSLWDYFNPDHMPRGRWEQAVAGARRVKSRQADSEMLLQEVKLYWLRELWRLDLDATPALCQAFGAAPLKQASADPDYDFNVAEDIEVQLPNMKWLAAARCDLDDGLAVAETRVRRVIAVRQGEPRWDQFLTELVLLHHRR
jgi:hypothetical protein